MTRSRLLVVALLGLAVLTPAAAQAQSSVNLNVSATVAAYCTITASPVVFGAYEPLGTHATNPLDASGGVTVTCTKGSAPKIALNGGGNEADGSRHMTNGDSGLLAYQLYQDAGDSSVWGANGDVLTAQKAPSREPRAFTVYARVPAGQDPPTGSYSDTVLATFNF